MIFSSQLQLQERFLISEPYFPSESPSRAMILEEIDENLWPARYGGKLRDMDIRVPNIRGVMDIQPSPYGNASHKSSELYAGRVDASTRSVF